MACENPRGHAQVEVQFVIGQHETALRAVYEEVRRMQAPTHFFGLYIIERKTNIFVKCTNSFISSSCVL